MGRIAVFQYITVAVFLFLIEGFWALQVRDYEANSELAERNRIKTVPLPAPRGKILDRDGRVIVDNQPSFSRGPLDGEREARTILRPSPKGLHLDLADLQARVQALQIPSQVRPDPAQVGADAAPSWPSSNPTATCIPFRRWN